MRKCLLDSSFLIDLLNEMAAGQAGPALSWLHANAAARLWITPVTMAEVLEGAEEPEVVRAYLAHFAWQGIHRVHADKVALRQRRASHRLGENDAWQVAIAEQMGAILVGHDHTGANR
jgi:predicted nucleic acid-binding protein